MRKLKKKIGNESTKKKIDKLMEVRARKAFNYILSKDVKAIGRSAFHTRLLDTLTGSMQDQDDVEEENIPEDEDDLKKTKAMLFQNIHNDSAIPESLVVTWMHLLLENMGLEKPMAIPDEFISDSMLDVWMKMKLHFLDLERKDMIDKIWIYNARLLSEKSQREKNEEIRRQNYIQSMSYASYYSSPCFRPQPISESLPENLGSFKLTDCSSTVVNENTPGSVPLYDSPMSSEHIQHSCQCLLRF